MRHWAQSVVGKGLFHPLAAPGSPYRHAALGRSAPAGRPTPTPTRPNDGAPVTINDLDLLADTDHLRAFTDVLACDLDRSELDILRTIVAVLQDKQRRQADDMSDVLRLGRVRQVATSELDRLLGRQ